MNIYRQVDGMRLKRDSATRILGIGNPWWVGKEVCCVLGIRNHRHALSRLDDDEKQLVILNDAIGRTQPTLWVAKEVCCVLGIKNHRDALSRLDDDEKDGVVLNDAIGRPQQTLMVGSLTGKWHFFQSGHR